MRVCRARLACRVPASTWPVRTLAALSACDRVIVQCVRVVLVLAVP
jgi:hypothetical protein